jgi:alpha-1,6-mannosyltransferase
VDIEIDLPTCELRTDIPGYDHNEFPGVVPRTFLGSLATSLIVSPISFFFQATYAPKVTSMNVARAGLALISVACTSAFRWQLGKRFGTSVSVAYACVTIVQFHINFYASRALPNTFALALSNLAYSYLLRDDYRTCMCILGFAAAVFRFEIVVLATPILAMAIVRKRLPLGNALVVGLWGVATGVAGALLSVCVDSVFWGRLVWPEFEGFVFNAVLNKSHEWGTSPFHWYLTSAIPRCMLGTPPTSKILYRKPSAPCHASQTLDPEDSALCRIRAASVLPQILESY